jgi:hypothetical protein
MAFSSQAGANLCQQIYALIRGQVSDPLDEVHVLVLGGA